MVLQIPQQIKITLDAPNPTTNQNNLMNSYAPNPTTNQNNLMNSYGAPNPTTNQNNLMNSYGAPNPTTNQNNLNILGQPNLTTNPNHLLNSVNLNNFYQNLWLNMMAQARLNPYLTNLQNLQLWNNNLLRRQAALNPSVNYFQFRQFPFMTTLGKSLKSDDVKVTTYKPLMKKSNAEIKAGNTFKETSSSNQDKKNDFPWGLHSKIDSKSRRQKMSSLIPLGKTDDIDSSREFTVPNSLKKKKDLESVISLTYH